MPFTGGCLCGAVRFTASDAETQFHACHCGTCRRWASGPVFGTRATDVAFNGADNIVRYASSDWAERGFCRTCGTHLFYFLKPASLYVMAVGAFDDADAFTLASELCVDRQPRGYALAGDLQRLTESELFAQFGS